MTAPRIIFATPECTPHVYLRGQGPARWLKPRYPGRSLGVYAGSQLSQFTELAARQRGATWHFHAVSEATVWLVRAVQWGGGRILLGLDDDLWHGPSDRPAGFPPLLVRDFEEAAALADAVVVTTDQLAALVKPLNATVFQIPNALPLGPAWPRRPVRPLRRVRRIGLSALAGHQRDWAQLRAPLLALLRARRDLTVSMLGDPPDWAYGHPQIEKHRGFVPYEAYLARLAALELDLLLAPLEASPFNTARSATKALEAAVAGAAFMGARVGPYRDLDHGATCWLVEPTEAAWDAALTELVRDPARVRALAAAGRDWALTSGTIETTGPLWAAALGLQG